MSCRHNNFLRWVGFVPNPLIQQIAELTSVLAFPKTGKTRKLWSPEGKRLNATRTCKGSIFWILWNSKTPVPRIPSIMFHRYNDDLGTLDDVINGVRKIGHSAYANSGFDFSKLGWSVPNSFNSRFDRIGAFSDLGCFRKCSPERNFGEC